MRVLEPRLAAHGISTGTWSFLRLLWLQDGMTQTELSQLMKVKEPTTVRALDRLQALGYVVRRLADADQRKRRIFLTDNGRALGRELLPLAHEVNEIGVSVLTKAEQKALGVLLSTVIKSLDDYVAEDYDASE